MQSGLEISTAFLLGSVSCSFPGILLFKFSPGFTRVRSMNFNSLTCPLSKSKESHWSCLLPKYRLRLKRVTDSASGETSGSCKDLQCVKGTAQAATISWSLLPSDVKGPLGIHCNTTCNSTQRTSDSITLLFARSWNMYASLREQPIEMDYYCLKSLEETLLSLAYLAPGKFLRDLDSSMWCWKQTDPKLHSLRASLLKLRFSCWSTLQDSQHDSSLMDVKDRFCDRLSNTTTVIRVIFLLTHSHMFACKNVCDDLSHVLRTKPDPAPYALLLSPPKIPAASLEYSSIHFYLWSNLA